LFLEHFRLWRLAFQEAQLRHTDVAIVGGGLAGSLAAAMLGRAGIDAVVIDPHPVYPPDFRCEKLDREQLGTLQQTGLADAVMSASTPDEECWVARFGRLVDKLPGVPQRGILYDTLVNTIRSKIPSNTEFIHAKVTGIATGRERQTVKLSNADEIEARLVVLATGLNVGLRQKLGIEREIISAGHSISIGFDVQPAGQNAFPFPALTYFTEKPADRMAYLTLFSIGGTVRANLFGYRDLHDPWLKQFRDQPRETLNALWPKLHEIMGDFTITGFVQIRPVDLYVTKGYRQNGVVLVGDAFSSSCPAAGTGARKALVDVERLCNVHIPRWLGSPGMGEAKISAFYDDPIKRACDTLSEKKAFRLRSYSIDTAPHWIALRFAKFVAHSGLGLLRRLNAVPAPAGGVHDEAQDQTSPWVRSTPAHK
jgi:2-polyprenyl-6-methoxyphenol hydroxylase-like FAD-dependent oxidoreductase